MARFTRLENGIVEENWKSAEAWMNRKKKNICSKCGQKMKSLTTIDDNWRVYKCKCGNEAMKHIHSK